MFCDLVNETYEEIVHWQHNVFMVPHGSISKAFVLKLA